MTTDTRLIDITLGELMETLRAAGFGQTQKAEEEKPQQPATKEKWLVQGLDGLAKLLGMSKTQAWRLRKTGLIDDATYSYGQIIVFDAEKVLEALKTRKRKISR